VGINLVYFENFMEFRALDVTVARLFGFLVIWLKAVKDNLGEI
jgi:hypothetical protein